MFCEERLSVSPGHWALARCPHGRSHQPTEWCLSCGCKGEPTCRKQWLHLTPSQRLYSGGHNLPVTWVLLNFLSAGYMKPGAHVKAGETFTYKWRVPENGGPSENDPPCLTYLYYSATDAVKDTNSGLVGPLLVCRKNVLNEDGTQVLSWSDGPKRAG